MTRNMKDRLYGFSVLGRQKGRLLATLAVIIFLLGVSLRSSFSFYATVFVTNTNDSGAGSLRQAIIDANLAPGTTIAFNIPTTDSNYSSVTGTFTIKPTTTNLLPSITANGTVIDGTTQTAFTGDTNTSGPEVVLNGGTAGAGVDGLNITASNCVVKGLTINGFNRDGVRISGAGATGNQVQGCYLGTNYAGSATTANGGNGVYILGGATNNTVGGTTTAERNLISGNSGSGVRLEGAGTNNNVVQGNYIGTNAAGTAAVANAAGGVFITTNPQNNTIGGTAAGAGNRISGNATRGINILGANNNMVQGNYVGLNAAGTAAVPNSGEGILIQSSAQNNTIGGTAAGAGNVISGNTGIGVSLASTNNVVQGNSIGLNAAGTAGLPNNSHGVDVSAGTNTVGGTAAGAGNRIAFNNGAGVNVTGSTTAGVTIRGNAIFSNGGLGIDLGGNGVTANDANDVDTGPNGLQNYPVLNSTLVSGGNTVIRGTLNSLVSTTFALDFYSSVAKDPSNFGEGETYIGSTNVTTDASGNATIDVTFAGDLTGRFITATATLAGNADTSEFSMARQAIPAPATSMAFTVQPSNTTAGAIITPAVEVSLLDDFGNVATAATDQVTLVIATNPGGGVLSGTTTRSPINGVVTFNNLSINKSGSGYTLEASAGSIPVVTSNPFDIVPGAPTKLGFTVQPSNVGAGVAIAPAVKVAVQDQFDNTVTTAADSMSIALGNNPGGGTLTGTTPRNAVNGVATFDDLKIDKMGNGYTLVASATGFSDVTSTTFNVTAGPPAQLAFTTPPSNTKANAAITPAVKVAVQDQFGNLVNTATNSVTVAIGTNPSGGTLSGSTTVNAVNGVATFSNLAIDRVGVGYTLTASAAGLTGATSPPFNITAIRLIFTTQPTNTVAGSTIAPAVQVAAQDSSGNTDTTFTGSITVAIGTNPSSGTLSGTKTANTVNGVATFNDLSIDKVGNGYTLTAMTTGLVNGTSAAFNVTPGAAVQLIFAVQPSNGTIGLPLTPAIQVAAQDALGNTDTNFTGAITVAIGTNPSGGILSGTTTRNAVNGVATFNDLSIDQVGNGYTLTASSGALAGATSNPFNISTFRLVFTIQPSNTTAGSAISPAVKVAVQDVLGNTITTATNSITVAIGTNPGGGTLLGTATMNAVNGVATFSNLSIEKAGNGYTLMATSPNLTDATSTAFNILPAQPSKMVFVQQPTNTVAGNFIAPAVKVAVRDKFDNVTTNVVNSITISIGTNVSGSTLGGVKTLNTINGVASFNDLSLDKVGTGYRLAASTSGIPDAVGDLFNITVNNASVVVFTQQPSDVAGGNPILPVVKVTIQDPFGNPITNATNPITISLGNNPSGGILYGTTTVNAVNGVATFDDLRIDKAGNNYTLYASDSGLGATNSAPFDVVSNETTAPTLTNPQVNPNNLTKDGGMVTLSVNATDNVQLQSVWAEVTKPDGSKQTVNLTLQSGNTYTGTFNAPLNPDVTQQTYNVVFSAKDNAGNSATPTTAVPFTVAAGPDALKPTLTNAKVSPNNLSENGGAVTLTVDATDNVGVTSVWAEVTKPDNTKQTVNLTLQSGNTYTGTFNAPANSTCDPQTYKVAFFAKDAVNNQGGPTSDLQFTVAENKTPFSLASATLDVTNLPNTGGAVLITANLTGCEGAVSLVATVTTGKGKKATTVATFVLTKLNDTTYTGTFNAPANNTKKVVTYKITVSLNNGAPVNAGTVTVAKKGKKAQSVLDNDEEDTLKIGASSPLRLRLLSANNGGAATVFTFTLNRAAAVTARVLSPTGKAVRQFGLRQATTGLNSLVWDGKAQSGGSVARGVYLIEILAQDEEGQVARAAQTVVVK